MTEQDASGKIPEKQSDYAERLLGRVPEDSYIRMWAELLQREKSTATTQGETSVLVFRIGSEWIGLSSKVLQEVLDMRPIHTVPSTYNESFLGVVNVRGQLRLCVALKTLLEISSPEQPQDHQRGSYGKKYRRMVVVRREAEVWVFPVDEVYGVVSCDIEQLENIPVTVLKSTANYLKGVWFWQEKRVAILEDELLFESLRRLIP